MNYLDNVEAEFKTVDILLKSETKTGRTDAFIISWVKVEKQIRKIFFYLLLQFPAFSESYKSKITKTLNLYVLYYDDFIKGFDFIHPESFKEIIGDDYEELKTKIDEIKRKYRNKILHGQLTGESLKNENLTELVEVIKDWVTLIGEKFSKKIQYDGIAKAIFNSEKKLDSDNFKTQITDMDSLKKFIEDNLGKKRKKG